MRADECLAEFDDGVAVRANLPEKRIVRREMEFFHDGNRDGVKVRGVVVHRIPLQGMKDLFESLSGHIGQQGLSLRGGVGRFNDGLGGIFDLLHSEQGAQFDACFR